MKTASEMTYIVSGGALNSTQTKLWNYVPNFGLRHGKSIVLSAKLVELVDHTYDGRHVVAAYHTSVDRNAPASLLQFVLDLLYNLFMYSCATAHEISTTTGRGAVRLRQQSF